MSFFKPIRPLLKAWAISFLGWGLLAWLIGAAGGGRDLSWLEQVRPGLRDWLPWAIATPLLARLVSRVSLDRYRWYVVAPVHLLVAVVVIASAYRWRESFYERERGGPGGPPPHGEFGPPPGPPPDFSRGGPPLPPPPDGFDGPPRGGPHGHRIFDLYHLMTFEVPIYFMIVGVAHAALFYRRSQERAASLAQARLEVLRMQLQPHFLFNTLNTIAGLVRDEPAKAEAMIDSLSGLLRLTLESSSTQELPLARELESVRQYLEIMQARWEDRLQFAIESSPEVNAALVPAFLLQPLVENAVEHGLQPKPEGGRVSVRAWREGPMLRLTVADDGVGLPAGQETSDGIGLGATRARLWSLHGARARLEMRNGHGASVEITLPFRSTSNLITE